MGKLSFTGIGVSDLTKSSKFYQDILGLEEKGLYQDVKIDLTDGNNFLIDEIVLGETAKCLGHLGRNFKTLCY